MTCEGGIRQYIRTQHRMVVDIDVPWRALGLESLAFFDLLWYVEQTWNCRLEHDVVADIVTLHDLIR